jgi:hypothetical protein
VRPVTDRDETAGQINATELTQLLRSFTMMLYEKDLITTDEQEWLFEQIDEVSDDV